MIGSLNFHWNTKDFNLSEERFTISLLKNEPLVVFLILKYRIHKVSYFSQMTRNQKIHILVNFHLKMDTYVLELNLAFMVMCYCNHKYTKILFRDFSQEKENAFQLIKFLMKLKLVITIKLFLKVKRNMEDIFLFKI